MGNGRSSSSSSDWSPVRSGSVDPIVPGGIARALPEVDVLEPDQELKACLVT